MYGCVPIKVLIKPPRRRETQPEELMPVTEMKAAAIRSTKLMPSTGMTPAVRLTPLSYQASPVRWACSHCLSDRLRVATEALIGQRSAATRFSERCG